MNSNTEIEVEEIAKRVGAIVTCPVCFSYDLHAGDDDADRLVYAEATNRAKDQITPGFRGGRTEEARSAVNALLSRYPYQCPGCRA